MNAQQVIDHLDGYINGFSDTRNSQWYVGIASDIEQRLFNDHSVDKESDAWAYSPADSSEIARTVEQRYLGMGFNGGPGGGDTSTNVVYVYIMTGTTNP